MSHDVTISRLHKLVIGVIEATKTLLELHTQAII